MGRGCGKIKAKGGEIHLNQKAVEIKTENNNVSEIIIQNLSSGELLSAKGDYYISTMPVKDLISSLQAEIPDEVGEAANGLLYRDFITVGLLLNKLTIKNESLNKLIPDNWMYIQEKNVKLGVFRFSTTGALIWSKIQCKVWLGLEYFCNEGDDLWNMEEKDLLILQ